MEAVLLKEGLWLLKEGEGPRDIARAAYKDPNKYQVILAANPFEWSPGVRLTVPNVSGYTAFIEEGEGPLSLLRRLFPEHDPAKRLDALYKWNGDSWEVGELVFVPKTP